MNHFDLDTFITERAALSELRELENDPCLDILPPARKRCVHTFVKNLRRRRSGNFTASANDKKLDSSKLLTLDIHTVVNAIRNAVRNRGLEQPPKCIRASKSYLHDNNNSAAFLDKRTTGFEIPALRRALRLV